MIRRQAELPDWKSSNLASIPEHGFAKAVSMPEMMSKVSRGEPRSHQLAKR